METKKFQTVDPKHRKCCNAVHINDLYEGRGNVFLVQHVLEIRKSYQSPLGLDDKEEVLT